MIDKIIRFIQTVKELFIFVRFIMFVLFCGSNIALYS